MKKKFNNLSKLLFATGCVSLLAYNIATAAPLKYDMSQPQAVRSEFSTPNKISLQGNVNFDDHGQKINLSLRNTDVQQVLRMFADKAGLNIVFHESATGTVTLDLVDVKLDDAFKMVMKMCNLTYVIKDKTMMVVGTDKAETLNLAKDNIAILPVKYADAAYLANFLNTNVFGLNTPGLSFGPIVTTNADRNELLIFGTENDYQMAKKIVDRFDKKPLMTTYRVNHTTPFEMAKMICETLFRLPFEGQTSTTGAGKGSYQSKLSAQIKTQTSKTNVPDGALGGGSIACVYSSGVTTGNLSSYSTKPTLVLYVQPELGTLTLIGGSEQQIQLVNEFILDNDRKQPQALLEVSIIELTEDGSKEFNSSWVLNQKYLSLDLNGGLNNATYFWHGKDGVGVLGNQRSLSQTISYLISNTKARMLANPKIIVTNGKKTTIDLTSDYVESTTVQILGNAYGDSTGSVQKTFEIGKDSGIKVEVTPFISPDGYVSLDLKPEFASELQPLTDQYPVGDGTYVPYTAAMLLQRHNLDLKSVRIKDEETLLIGGLIEQREDDVVSKVPILGDIPIVGFLFRNQSKKMRKHEILFMITPRIIKDTEDVAEL